MQRILVGGITGVGKTTFARSLSRRLGLPYHDMDAMYHGPNWQPISSFDADVAQIVATPRWIFDSDGYRSVRDLMWGRADAVIWLDFSRTVVMSRVLRRSALRALGHEPIFNGNVETFRDWLDPEHPVQWAWTQYAHRRQAMLRRFADPSYAQVRRICIRKPQAADEWLANVSAGA